jgi:hydrogenase maturation protease
VRDPRAARPLVVGLGAEDRSDDGVGLDVVRALRTGPLFPADLEEEPGDMTRLLDRWEGRPLVVLIDAVRSGLPAGTVHRWADEELDALPEEPAVSTHGLSLAHVLRLARDLGRLPARLVVYGVEAGSTEVGERRSEDVREAVPEVCRRIGLELASLAVPRTPSHRSG